MIIHMNNMKGQLIPTYIGCLFVGMSNPLVLPQCMGSVVTEDKQRSTIMMSQKKTLQIVML